MAFDLLYLNGKDLRTLPLIERPDGARADLNWIIAARTQGLN